MMLRLEHNRLYELPASNHENSKLFVVQNRETGPLPIAMAQEVIKVFHDWLETQTLNTKGANHEV